MKKLLKFLWRDKIDFMMMLLVLAAFIQWHFMNSDITYGYILVAVYIVYVMLRFGNAVETIRKQDRDILNLNLRIQEKDQEITELIQRYGLTLKAKQTFKQKLDKAFKDQRNEKRR